MISRFPKDVLPVLFAAHVLTACGCACACGGGGSAEGGNNGSSNGNQTAPANAPSVRLNFGGKQFQFSWNAVGGATHYRLLEDIDGASGYVQVGSVTPSTASTYNITHAINLVQRINARYIVQACNAGGCKDSAPVEWRDSWD